MSFGSKVRVLESCPTPKIVSGESSCIFTARSSGSSLKGSQSARFASSARCSPMWHRELASPCQVRQRLSFRAQLWASAAPGGRTWASPIRRRLASSRIVGFQLRSSYAANMGWWLPVVASIVVKKWGVSYRLFRKFKITTASTVVIIAVPPITPTVGIVGAGSP